MTRRIIAAEHSAYLKLRIDSGTPAQVKQALQEISSLYRRGQRVGSPEQLHALENSISGLIFTRSDDPKIRRWALNALARVGKAKSSLPAVMHVLEKYSSDPQAVGSAVAAFFALEPARAHTHLQKGNSFDPDLVALAALQTAKLTDVDVSATRINIDKASVDILKLALIVVGMEKAPEHIFHPRHANAELVRALGGHDDIIVSQYSVWAVVENSQLNFGHLGLNLKDIESYPDNIRAWVLRLVAMQPKDVRDAIDYLRLGIEDACPEVRSGVALGLQQTFFDGLEPIILDWCYNEDDPDVQHHILDHLVRNVGPCPAYHRHVMGFYEKEPKGSARRTRMEGMAAGTHLYGAMKAISLGGPDLFRSDIYINLEGANVKSVSIGNIQAGAVAVGGNATNSGEVRNAYSHQTLGKLNDELDKALALLKGLQIDNEAKQGAVQAIAAAKADPTPSTFSKVAAGLKGVAATIGLTANAVTDLSLIATTITALLAGL